MLYRVQPAQSLIDITVQYTGDVLRVFELLDANPGLRHDSVLSPGQVLTLPDAFIAPADADALTPPLPVELRRRGRVVATQSGGALLLPPGEVVVPPPAKPRAFSDAFDNAFA